MQKPQLTVKSTPEEVQNAISSMVKEGKDRALRHASVGGVKLEELAVMAKHFRISSHQSKKELVDALFDLASSSSSLLGMSSAGAKETSSGAAATSKTGTDASESSKEKPAAATTVALIQKKESRKLDTPEAIQEAIEDMVKIGREHALLHANSGGEKIGDLKIMAKHLRIPISHPKEVLVEEIFNKMTGMVGTERRKSLFKERFGNGKELLDVTSSTSSENQSSSKNVSEESAMSAIKDMVREGRKQALRHASGGGEKLEDLMVMAKYLGISSHQSKKKLVDAIFDRIAEIDPGLEPYEEKEDTEAGEASHAFSHVSKKHSSSARGLGKSSKEVQDAIKDLIECGKERALLHASGGGMKLEDLKAMAKLLGIHISQSKEKLVDAIFSEVSSLNRLQNSSDLGKLGEETVNSHSDISDSAFVRLANFLFADADRLEKSKLFEVCNDLEGIKNNSHFKDSVEKFNDNSADCGEVIAERAIFDKKGVKPNDRAVTGELDLNTAASLFHDTLAAYQSSVNLLDAGGGSQAEFAALCGGKSIVYYLYLWLNKLNNPRIDATVLCKQFNVSSKGNSLSTSPTKSSSKNRSSKKNKSQVDGKVVEEVVDSKKRRREAALVSFQLYREISAEIREYEKDPEFNDKEFLQELKRAREEAYERFEKDNKE